MSAKTKILILKKRELIYTGIFLALGITLIILLVLMFRPGGNTTSPASSRKIYVPGIYTIPITLNGTSMNLEVRVDESRINNIQLVNLNEAVASMFPLMKPSLENITAQIYQTQSTDNLYYEAANQYTSQMLIKAIDEALSLAKY